MFSTYIYFIAIELCLFLAVSTGHFWLPIKFENMANPDYKNLKHLQKLDHFSLTGPCIYLYYRQYPKPGI